MMISLSELVDIKGGGTPTRSIPEYWDGGIPWATVKDFKSSELSGAQEYISELGVDKSATNIIPAGNIIVPTRMAVGKVAINSVDIAINQDLKAIIVKDEKKLNKKYLLRFLESKARYLENQGKGATVKGITLDVLKDLEIPVLKITEQKRIAAILDKAENLRRKRQQAIKLADEFLRSVFLDMFGDPVTNPKGWDLMPLSELTSKIGSGATPRGGKESYIEEGLSLIRSLNVHDNKFIYKNLAFITGDQASALSNVVVEANDVLLNITGASVCRSCIVPESILPARVNQHVCIIRPIESTINSNYLLNLFISNGYKKKLLLVARAGGATREALTKKQVEELEVPVPPIEIQLKFKNIIDKLISVINKEQESTKWPLLSSLSKKAFAGEL